MCLPIRPRAASHPPAPALRLQGQLDKNLENPGPGAYEFDIDVRGLK